MPTSSSFFGNMVPILPRLLHHLLNPFATRFISSTPPDQPDIETRQDVIATRQLANFFDSTINGTTLRNTSFMSCTLNRVEIHGSVISDSILSNCQLSNCTMKYSSVVDSKLHETKIFDCSMDNCTMTMSPLALRKFPPEIRAMIFEDCLDINDEECQGIDKSNYPALLSALRCDKAMFQEAMDIMSKVNWHCLCLQNLSCFKLWPSKETESIRKLNIR
jgi:Pentapeptide repeats (8 copies)